MQNQSTAIAISTSKTNIDVLRTVQSITDVVVEMRKEIDPASKDLRITQLLNLLTDIQLEWRNKI